MLAFTTNRIVNSTWTLLALLAITTPAAQSTLAAQDRQLQDAVVHRDVVFGTGGGRELTMHIVMPEGETTSLRPAYVWIHGGGWRAGSKEGGIRQVLPLVRQGFVGVTIEYRLTGEAAFPAQIEDCKCAIRFLRAHKAKYGIDPERIAVGGSSAGGHLAALVGTSAGERRFEGAGGWPDEDSSVQAVVDLFGPTDFAAFVTTEGYRHHNKDGSPESMLLGGGVVLENFEELKLVNPITYVDAKDPPFLIFHGTEDRVVPINQSERLHKSLTAVGVKSIYHPLDGADHGGQPFASPDVRKQIQDFLVQILKR